MSDGFLGISQPEPVAQIESWYHQGNLFETGINDPTEISIVTITGQLVFQKRVFLRDTYQTEKTM
jgi:hypothetical protein